MTAHRGEITAMKLPLSLLACTLGLVPAFAAPARAQQPAEQPPVYDEKADARADIAAALARAQRDNRRVLVQWGANWCGWCKKLHALCSENAEVRQELLYEFDVVRVDVGQFDKNMDIAAGYGAALKDTGIPYLTVLAADGKVLVNQDTGSLEAGPNHDPAKVLAFLTAHQAPYLKAADRYQAALAEATKQQKHLFLSFGAPWCGWCHRLEDWMARPEIAALLARDFVCLKIDTERDVGGQEMLDRLSLKNSGGIPWFAFLDAQGKELANSTGPKGNTGYPASDEEIAWFLEMLKAGAPRLSADDRATLQRSLVENRPKEH